MQKTLITYCAFLRGINVGGGHVVKMAELKKVLESLKLLEVRTLLASGNVIFKTGETNISALTKKVENKLQQRFGFAIPIIVRTEEQVKDILKNDPFKNIKVNKNTRLYVTFLKQKSVSKLKIPYKSPQSQFSIIKVTNGEIFSVLQLDGNRKTVDLMSIIEKEFGKNVTTRNWNTVKRMVG